MSYEHSSPAQLLTELINAAAQAGHHAERNFYNAETDLYSDMHMREAQEIKAAILAQFSHASSPAPETTHTTPHTLPKFPDSRLNLPGLDDRL